ncbi:hypothetical protein LOTGIDRAFT_176521 [Lottia gigantea]|uniref:Uncharacterized protein n=1 Tax=Lottia gigantea TaxID=225164 RepID=V4C9Q8_LOTGI|nr:hypothetical protein LOTGIDRAFT_176521 [Lottia gigantea]ESO98494.1 hypothetical protein LOTGIDRAFT_176521 [Lottia gigantea]
MVGGASVRLKAFYEKYLYPYELFIKGGDYTSYISSSTTKKPGPKKKTAVFTPEDKSTNNHVVDKLDPVEDVEKGTEDFDYVTAAKNKLGIDITFFDETPPSKDEVKTPSEFEEAVLPVESAHKVPNMEMYSNPMSDLDSQEELIHEMQALQDGMELIDQVLEQL